MEDGRERWGTGKNVEGGEEIIKEGLRVVVDLESGNSIGGRQEEHWKAGSDI